MPAAKGSARTPLGPIVATFVYASSQGQRTLSARTNKIEQHPPCDPNVIHCPQHNKLGYYVSRTQVVIKHMTILLYHIIYNIHSVTQLFRESDDS